MATSTADTDTILTKSPRATPKTLSTPPPTSTSPASSLPERNGRGERRGGRDEGGLGHWNDENISQKMVMQGDFVVRVVDAEYAIRMVQRIIPGDNGETGWGF
ncbi:hypothetical protein CFE70_009383 [Pyrenophora teres f. teres 0-1]